MRPDLNAGANNSIFLNAKLDAGAEASKVRPLLLVQQLGFQSNLLSCIAHSSASLSSDNGNTQRSFETEVERRAVKQWIYQGGHTCELTFQDLVHPANIDPGGGPL